MRLGISSYTYVWAVGVPGYPQPRQPLTAKGLLAKAAELEVRVIQIADNLPLDRLTSSELESLARQAQELGIAVEVGTCGIEPAHLQAYLALALKLGSSIVRVVIDTETQQPAPEMVIGLLREILPDYRRAGVCLAIENHDRFPAATLLRIIGCCENPNLGICLDTANSLGCGEDLQSVLSVLGKYVVNLHVKDFRVERLPHKKGFVVEGCPAGEGVVDIPRLLAELRNLNRDPNIVLELWPPPKATIDESIANEDSWARQSIRFLRHFVQE